MENAPTKEMTSENNGPNKMATTTVPATVQTRMIEVRHQVERKPEEEEEEVNNNEEVVDIPVATLVLFNSGAGVLTKGRSGDNNPLPYTKAPLAGNNVSSRFLFATDPRRRCSLSPLLLSPLFPLRRPPLLCSIVRNTEKKNNGMVNNIDTDNNRPVVTFRTLSNAVVCGKLSKIDACT